MMCERRMRRNQLIDCCFVVFDREDASGGYNQNNYPKDSSYNQMQGYY